MVCDVELEILLPQLAAVQVEGVWADTWLIRIAAACRGQGDRRAPGSGRPIDAPPVLREPRMPEDHVRGARGWADVRYQRRTSSLQQLLGAVAVVLAGKTAARLLPYLHQLVSCSTLLPALPVPRVLGVETSPCGVATATGSSSAAQW